MYASLAPAESHESSWIYFCLMVRFFIRCSTGYIEIWSAAGFKHVDTFVIISHF